MILSQVDKCAQGSETRCPGVSAKVWHNRKEEAALCLRGLLQRPRTRKDCNKDKIRRLRYPQLVSDFVFRKRLLYCSVRYPLSRYKL